MFELLGSDHEYMIHGEHIQSLKLEGIKNELSS